MKSNKFYSCFLLILIIASHVAEVHGKLMQNRLTKKIMHANKRKISSRIKSSPFEITGAVAIFFLQIVRKLNMGIVSEYAEKAVNAKQWSEACLRGVSQMLGLGYPLGDQDVSIDSGSEEDVKAVLNELKSNLAKEAKYYIKDRTLTDEELHNEEKLCELLINGINESSFNPSKLRGAFDDACIKLQEVMGNSVNACFTLSLKSTEDFFYRQLNENYASSCLFAPKKTVGLVPPSYYGTPIGSFGLGNPGYKGYIGLGMITGTAGLY